MGIAALVASGVVLGIAWPQCGCGGRSAGRGAPQGSDPKAHARSEEARWVAVAMPHRKVTKVLGGHRFEARHELGSLVDGKAERSFVEEYLLECRSQGDCHGRLDNSKEYGVEFVRIGEETFFRHRYQEYLKFAEEREEAERRKEQIFGVGSAVLALLAPGVRLDPAGETSVEGRRAARYRVVKRRVPLRARSAEGTRAWRARMIVEQASGEVWLDRSTGAPLRFDVRYRVVAPKGKRRVALEGALRAELKALGKAPAVKAPERFTEAAPRDREKLDVRALLGDQRLNPGWFRGGGPHAARERERRSPARREGADRPGPSGGKPSEAQGASAAPARPAPASSAPALRPAPAPRPASPPRPSRPAP